jgi:hypothetical protein
MADKFKLFGSRAILIIQKFYLENYSVFLDIKKNLFWSSSMSRRAWPGRLEWPSGGSAMDKTKIIYKLGPIKYMEGDEALVPISTA